MLNFFRVYGKCQKKSNINDIFEYQFNADCSAKPLINNEWLFSGDYII